MQTTSDITIMGDLTINGTLDIGTNTDLEIQGNYTNNGTFTSSGETITFSGAGSHTATAINNPTTDIIVNKSSNGSLTFSGVNCFDEFSITVITL